MLNEILTVVEKVSKAKDARIEEIKFLQSQLKERDELYDRLLIKHKKLWQRHNQILDKFRTVCSIAFSRTEKSKQRGKK